MKVCIIDLETTGLDPLTHEIIEIGGVTFDSRFPPDFKEIDMKVIPENIERASPEAMRVNGYDPVVWRMEGMPLVDALTYLQQWCDGRVFMAYNVTFDWGFIEQAYKKCGLRNPFNYHKLCVMTYAWSKLPMLRSLKLKDVCEELGIEPEPDVHRALNGAKRAFEVYKKVTFISNPAIPMPLP